jgi:hypothetical protein
MNNSVYDAASEQVRGKFVKLQKPLQHVAQPSRWPIAMRPKRAWGALAGTGQSLRNRPGG